MSAPRSSRFSPHLVRADRLAALFVGRWPVVERLVEDTLSVAAAGGSRYEVVVAPRGAGKSHLFALVAARLRERGAAGGLRVFQLAEEEYPASLVDLLARFLTAAPPVEGLPTPEEHVGVLRRAAPADRVATAVGLLEVRAGDGPVVLLAENLDRVFEALGREGQQQLRSILSSHPRWSIVATSCTYGPDFTDGRAPFYKMFARVTLPALTDDQAVDLLRRLAREHDDARLLEQLDAPGGPVRVRAIRYLVGDNPRAMAILFPFLRDGRLDDLEGVFLDLAEELTPYFQDQMSRIPAGQRPYLELLAGSWRPQTVGELADATFATPQTASGQLRYLKRDGLVTAMQVGREVFYELAEPLHRLASAMKHPERAPLTLARFLVAWLPSERVRVGWEEAGRRDGDVWDLALRLGSEEPSAYEKGVVKEVRALKAAGETAKALALAREGWDRTHGASVGASLYVLTTQYGTVEEASDFAAELLHQCPGRGWEMLVFGLFANGLPLPPPVLDECRHRWREDFAAMPTGYAAAGIVALEGPGGELWDHACRVLTEKPPDRALRGVLRQLVEGGAPDLAVELAMRWGVAKLDSESFQAVLPLLGESGRGGEALLALLDAVTAEPMGVLQALERARAMCWMGAVEPREVQAARERIAAAPPRVALHALAAGLAYDVGDTRAALHDLESVPADWGAPHATPALLQIALAGGRWERALAMAAFAKPELRQSVEWLVSLASGEDPLGSRPPFPDNVHFALDAIARWLAFGQAPPERAARVVRALADLPAWSMTRVLAQLQEAARRIEHGEPPSVDRINFVSEVAAALRGLPDDLAPYARLASPERRFLRIILRSAGAQRLLDALPPEPS